MNKCEVLDLIRETGMIVVMRADNSEQMLEAAGALREGGAKILEVTMTTPSAISIIETAASQMARDVVIGAGTVLDTETARAAILAGAEFIVSPSLHYPVVQMCRRYSIPVFPGAFTPTEILSAWEHGADMVKVFPASMGGPGLIKALKAPLPQVEMVAVGGVNLETTAAFIKAGASAVAVGGGLVNQKVLDEANFESLKERARLFLAEIALARSE